jgi:hypothetical protein
MIFFFRVAKLGEFLQVSKRDVHIYPYNLHLSHLLHKVKGKPLFFY